MHVYIINYSTHKCARINGHAYVYNKSVVVNCNHFIIHLFRCIRKAYNILSKVFFINDIAVCWLRLTDVIASFCLCVRPSTHVEHVIRRRFPVSQT